MAEFAPPPPLSNVKKFRLKTKLRISRISMPPMPICIPPKPNPPPPPPSSRRSSMSPLVPPGVQRMLLASRYRMPCPDSNLPQIHGLEELDCSGGRAVRMPINISNVGEPALTRRPWVRHYAYVLRNAYVLRKAS